MFSFESDRRLVSAILDGVAEMHRAHGAGGTYDTHDLVNWLNDRRNSELNEIIARYPNGDAVHVATVQIGRYLQNRLGQRKVDDRVSTREDIALRAGVRGGGDCKVSVWEVSRATEAALDRAREALRERGGPPGPADPTAPVDLGWIGRIAGSFKDDPVFAEVVELGRARRVADRPDDEP